MRDYIAEILEEAPEGSAEVPAASPEAPEAARRAAAAESAEASPQRRQLPRAALLRARLRAIGKAISVEEVVRRRAAERGIIARSSVVLRGMEAEGPDRRDRPEIEIALDFHWAAVSSSSGAAAGAATG